MTLSIAQTIGVAPPGRGRSKATRAVRGLRSVVRFAKSVQPFISCAARFLLGKRPRRVVPPSAASLAIDLVLKVIDRKVWGHRRGSWRPTRRELAECLAEVAAGAVGTALAASLSGPLAPLAQIVAAIAGAALSKLACWGLAELARRFSLRAPVLA